MLPRDTEGEPSVTLIWPLVPAQRCCHWVCPPHSLCWGSSQFPGPRWPHWSSGGCRSAVGTTPASPLAPSGNVRRRAPPISRPGTEEAGTRWGKTLSLFSGCCWLLSGQWNREGDRRSNVIWKVCYWRLTVICTHYVFNIQSTTESR